MWARLAQGGTPWDIARDESAYPLERLLEAADAVGRDDTAPQQRARLKDAHEGVRYWAAVGFNAREKLDAADLEALRAALADTDAVVRIEAAAALARHGEGEAALPVLTAALADSTFEIALHAARALQMLGPVAEPARKDMAAALTRARQAEATGETMAMFIRFSLEAALEP